MHVPKVEIECAIGEAENKNEVFSALAHNTKNPMQIYLTTAGIGLKLILLCQSELTLDL